jgi:hypothetical protein
VNLEDRLLPEVGGGGRLSPLPGLPRAQQPMLADIQLLSRNPTVHKRHSSICSDIFITVI